MTTNLTNQEIEELRIAIAECVGWKHTSQEVWRTGGPHFFIGGIGEQSKKWFDFIPPYTTSIDSIRESAMERFKSQTDQLGFECWLERSATYETRAWQLTALDWSIAFARTAKIWRYKV